MAQEHELMAQQPDREYTTDIVRDMIHQVFGENYTVSMHGSHKYGIATVFSDVDLMIEDPRSPSMCSVDSANSQNSQDPPAHVSFIFRCVLQ